MASIDHVGLDLTVLIGAVEMPLARAMTLDRGTVIPLDRTTDAPLTVLANGAPVAEGRVKLLGERIAVEITRAADAASDPSSDAA